MEWFYQESQRLQSLPTYVFAKLDELKAIERAKGVDLIDFGMGNPDLPVPSVVIDEFQKALRETPNWRYPEFSGLPEFREAVAGWCQRQYQVTINPKDEVLPLIGSKEGIVHFLFSILNPGDITLTPMPAYPAHFRGTLIAGGCPMALPVDAEHQPCFEKIPADVLEKTKVIILSTPTNPTAHTAARASFEKAVAFCRKHQKILLHDFAYAEVYFENQKPISMLSIPGAKEVCIEFHTCSKTFSMAGFRIGFAIGNPRLIQTLSKIKTNLDYGLCMVNQRAAAKALTLTDQELDPMRKIYQKRRDLMVQGLQSLGCKLEKPMATMYIWVPVPHGFDSTSFSLKLIKEAGVVVAPGTAFGDEGQGYVRLALVDSESRIEEALERLKKAGVRWG
jgi:LL-diaminopimelate aminotransferase